MYRSRTRAGKTHPYVVGRIYFSKTINLSLSVQAKRVEQISSELQRALLPVQRVFFQGAEYLGFDHDVHFRIDRAQRGRSRIEQLYAEIADALRGERRPPGEHFVSDYAQAVNIRAKVGLLSAKLFRTQVSRAQRQLSA